MSEEQQSLQNEKKENSCKVALLTVLTVLALLFSIASLVLSIITFNGGNIASGGAQASADKNAISVKYDKGRSLDKALKTGKPVIVFFYTDWCGFCQRFAPTFDAVTKDSKVKKEFAIAYVNCEKPESHDHMQNYGVQAFPTVFVVKKDGNKKQLENQTFFTDDAKEVLIKNVLSEIGK